MKMVKKIALLALIFLFFESNAQKGTVLFFIAQDSAYYSEYIVAYQSLIAAGYSVDTRSATSNPVFSYMIPSGTTINATANSLSNSSYSDFTQQFLNLYGSVWDAGFNSIPANIPVDGSILNVSNMSNYVALVVAGGKGIQNYRVDGSYSAQGGATSNEIQQVAEKLNALAIDALLNEKPVLAQCHGASLPVFWRVPGTSGTGSELLGYSLLKGEKAAGFPSGETTALYANLNVDYLSSNQVMVSSPHSSLSTKNGDYKIITSADWYPQTVLYAIQTLINSIETHPVKSNQEKATSVLLIHGGAINESNCSAGNKVNDVPCNYGTGSNLPADYTHLRALLETNGNDDFNLQVTDLNLTAALPFNNTNQSEILSYLSNYDAVVFFKHWSTGMTDELQYALKDYVDNGGGIVALHHGMYNDVSSGQSKTVLMNEVFGVSSEMNTWSAGLNSFTAINTNYGHFVSTYGVPQETVEMTPVSWATIPPLKGSNLSFVSYPQISMYDEVYNNMSFTGTPVFGFGENEITPIFSNTSNPNSQIHTTGFVKLFNPSNNGTVGRIVCLAQGERRESMNVNHPYGQVIRNAVVWGANQSGLITNSDDIREDVVLNYYPNPVTNELTVELNTTKVDSYRLFGINGNLILFQKCNGVSVLTINTTILSKGTYLLEVNCNGVQKTVKFVK